MWPDVPSVPFLRHYEERLAGRVRTLAFRKDCSPQNGKEVVCSVYCCSCSFLRDLLPSAEMVVGALHTRFVLVRRWLKGKGMQAAHGRHNRYWLWFFHVHSLPPASESRPNQKIVIKAVAVAFEACRSLVVMYLIVEPIDL
jgi:hypothetical protein